MSNEDGRKVELCGLWEHTSASGSKYWSGTLGGAKVLVFKNSKKTEGSKVPDMHIYLVPADRKTGTPFVRKGPEKVVETLNEYNGFSGKNDDLGF